MVINICSCPDHDLNSCPSASFIQGLRCIFQGKPRREVRGSGSNSSSSTSGQLLQAAACLLPHCIICVWLPFSSFALCCLPSLPSSAPAAFLLFCPFLCPMLSSFSPHPSFAPCCLPPLPSFAPAVFLLSLPLPLLSSFSLLPSFAPAVFLLSSPFLCPCSFSPLPSFAPAVFLLPSPFLSPLLSFLPSPFLCPLAVLSSYFLFFFYYCLALCAGFTGTVSRELLIPTYVCIYI